MTDAAETILPLTSPSIQAEYATRCATWSDIQGHLEFMHDFAIAHKARTIVELGVRSGNSTSAFLAAVEHTDGQVWSVDVEQPSHMFDSPRWHLIIGHDLDVANQVPHWIDVLFIDTSHEYQHTLAELRLYGPRARHILLHDTDLEHPWGLPKHPAFPVRCAIDAWCAETGNEWENREGSYGLGVIHVKRKRGGK